MPKRIMIKPPIEKMQEAVSLAKARNEKEKIYGGMNYGNKRGSLQAHLIGIFGELGVGHFAKAELDKIIYKTHGDDGVDLKTAGFGLSQVKTTTYDPPWLRVEKDKINHDVKNYFLCIVPKFLWLERLDTISITIVGYATKEMVLAKPLSDPIVEGGPRNYILEEKELLQVPNDFSSDFDAELGF